MFRSRRARQIRALFVVVLPLVLIGLAVASFYIEDAQPVHSALSNTYHFVLSIRHSLAGQ